MARLHICLHETANRAIAKASYTQRLQKSGQTLGCSFRFRGQNCVFQGGTGSLSLFSVAPDFLLRLACNMPPTPQVKKMTSCNIKVMLLLMNMMIIGVARNWGTLAPDFSDNQLFVSVPKKILDMSHSEMMQVTKFFLNAKLFLAFMTFRVTPRIICWVIIVFWLKNFFNH